jgi:hypothetical protein
MTAEGMKVGLDNLDRNDSEKKPFDVMRLTIDNGRYSEYNFSVKALGYDVETGRMP